MADWLLSAGWLARANRFYYHVRGRSLDFLEDLRRFPGSALDFPLKPLPHLRVVHVLGFPLRRHLHQRRRGVGHQHDVIVLVHR